MKKPSRLCWTPRQQRSFSQLPLWQLLLQWTYPTRTRSSHQPNTSSFPQWKTSKWSQKDEQTMNKALWNEAYNYNYKIWTENPWIPWWIVWEHALILVLFLTNEEAALRQRPGALANVNHHRLRTMNIYMSKRNRIQPYCPNIRMNLPNSGVKPMASCI